MQKISIPGEALEQNAGLMGFNGIQWDLQLTPITSYNYMVCDIAIVFMWVITQLMTGGAPNCIEIIVRTLSQAYDIWACLVIGRSMAILQFH